MLHLGVHDASRFAWMVELPLPEEGERKMDLQVSVEIPAHIFSDHDPWTRLQLLARLGSPERDVPAEVQESTDAIRRATLAAAHRAKLRRRSLLRAAMNRVREGADWTSIGDELETLVDRGIGELRSARDALGRIREGDPPRVQAERRLAAEYLSYQVIDLISRTQRAIERVAAGDRRPIDDEMRAAFTALRRHLAHALGEEYAYRREKAFPCPTSADPVELEHYVSRAASLKKHFQQLLFLRVESEHADKRFRYLASSAAAISAALVVIPVVAITTGGHGLTGLGFGLTSTFLIAILAYGVRERIKEGVRGWLTSRAAKVGRRTTLTTSARPPGEPTRVGRVREIFSTRRTKEQDPAHPDLQTSMPMIRLGYQMFGTLEGSPVLAERGAQRVKLVFRYDFTPLFSRLHDPVEEVPILDESGETLSFAEAPRLYRFPIEGKLFDGEKTHTFTGKLLAHKYGLVRIEPDPEMESEFFEERAASIPAGVMRRR